MSRLNWIIRQEIKGVDVHLVVEVGLSGLGLAAEDVAHNNVSWSLKTRFFSERKCPRAS